MLLDSRWASDDLYSDESDLDDGNRIMAIHFPYSGGLPRLAVSRVKFGPSQSANITVRVN
jgi:hypothetical protein